MTPAPDHRTSRPLLSRLRAVADLYTYPLRLSHYAELVNPLWSTHKLQARVVEIWDETRNSRTLTLKPGLNWRGHRAGQHIRVGVPVEGMHYTRTYTISSPPERRDGRFTITVKAIDGGRISHYLVRKVRVGDFLPVGLPQGDFYLPDAQPVRPLFITAGSGITPAMSMLRSLVAQQRLPDTVHIHYAPHDRDLIFGAELAQLAQEHDRYTLHPVYTHEYGAEKQTKGYFFRRPAGPAVPGLARARGLRLRPAGPAGRAGGALCPGRRKPPPAHRALPRRFCRPARRRHRRPGALRQQRNRSDGRRRRPFAARGRGCRAEPAARLPHGHLPYLHHRTARRRRA